MGELSKVVPRDKEARPGEPSEPQVTGSVTLRCTDGRVAGYGENAGGLRVLDNTRRCWVLFGPPAVEGSTIVSCDRIFGSRVGPWLRMGERLGVV